MEIDKIIGRSFLALLAQFLSGASSVWRNSQPDTCQRVYFGNHSSHLDVIALWSALPPYVRKVTRLVAAKDYWDATPIRRYISRRLFNAILIEREDVKVHSSPVLYMLEEMGNKYSIIVFPEGGRQSGGEIAEFKSGLYYLCKRRPELELIPVYLDNMNRILPRGAYLPVPMLSRVVFGPPMWLEKNEKKADFLARARQAVIDLRSTEHGL